MNEWLKWGLMGALAMGILAAGTTDTAIAQSGGDAGAIKVAAGAIGKSCGGSHKPFRGPKQKKK